MSESDSPVTPTTCEQCGKTLPPPRATGRRRHYCSGACRDGARRAAHREELRAYSAAYDAAHREERRAYGAAHREEKRAYTVAYNATHREERRAYGAAHREEKCAYNAALYAAQVEERRAYNVAYNATHREERRAHHAAHQEEERAYRVAHREEINARGAAWAAANPEKNAARSRNRRARLRGAPDTHTAADVAAQYLRQHGRCYWMVAKECIARGGKVGKKYHVDHVFAITKDGSNGPSNLVIACPDCNLSKGAKLPHEFSDRLC